MTVLTLCTVLQNNVIEKQQLQCSSVQFECSNYNIASAAKDITRNKAVAIGIATAINIPTIIEILVKR